MKRKITFIPALVLVLAGVACGNTRSAKPVTDEASEATLEMSGVVFDADSAFAYLEKQCDFGPRIPDTDSHKRCGDWLESELKRHGATVEVQRAKLTAADGTPVNARNIIGQYNPEARERLLLLAHWDTRPIADEDPVEGNRNKPVVGANDGASGVAVLLEIARQMSVRNPERGVDILFVDVEDMGERDNDESWALGARHFAANPFKEGYAPAEAILLDMVGGQGAVFTREYFSMQAAPDLVDRLWSLGRRLGYTNYFSDAPGGAVTDDHVELIKQGIPAVDIIETNPNGGFNRWWHTTGDTPDKIDRASLKAVGQTVTEYIYSK